MLATLALAVAANASGLQCYDLFASRHAPLRPGNSVTLRYSFADANANAFTSAALRSEVMTSSVRESHRLQDESSRLRIEGAALVRKTSQAAAQRRVEISNKLRALGTEQDRVERIGTLALAGRPLSRADLDLVRSHTFQQTIALSGRKQASQLSQRIDVLNGHLAAIENFKVPPGRVKRVYRMSWKGRLITLVLISAAAGLAQQGYDLYTAHQADVNAPIITQVYDESAAPVGPAHDNAAEAVGN